MVQNVAATEEEMSRLQSNADLERSSESDLEGARRHEGLLARPLSLIFGIGGVLVLLLVPAASRVQTASFSGLIQKNQENKAALLSSGGPIRNGHYCIATNVSSVSTHTWPCAVANNDQMFSLLPSSCTVEASKQAKVMWMSNGDTEGFRCLDTDPKSADPAANIQVASCATSKVFSIPEGRKGEIKDLSDPSKCLVVAQKSGPLESGSLLHMWDCKSVNDKMKTWDLSEVPSYVVGTIKINGKCVTAQTTKKSPAKLQTCNEGADQKFIMPESGRTGLIRSQVQAGLCLDIVDAKIVKGSSLQFFSCVDGGHKAQLFDIPSVTDTAGGHCKVSVEQSLCLTEHNGQVTLGDCDTDAKCLTEHDCTLEASIHSTSPAAPSETTTAAAPDEATTTGKPAAAAPDEATTTGKPAAAAPDEATTTGKLTDMAG